MESRVRAASREILNGLKNAEDTQSIVKWLHVARCVSIKTKESNLPTALQHYDDVQYPLFNSLFLERHFASVCFAILDLLSVEWLHKLPENCFRENVETLFLDGPASDSFLTLDRAIQKNGHGFKLQKITLMLETFINKDRLVQVIWDQCQRPESPESQHLHAVLSSHGGLWEDLVTSLVSMPSRMANRLGREVSDVFLPQHYVPHMGSCILQCLQRAHDLVVDGNKCSLDFVSRLVGKLCFTGYADQLLDVLVPVLCSSVNTDNVWSTVSERVFMGLPLVSMESVLVPLLSKIPWYMSVEKVLGDGVLRNQRVRFLLCTKLLFHRYFSQDLLLQNLLGYLATGPSRKALYFEVFTKLLKVWGDASNLRHVPAEQHLFLCRSLMVCVSHAAQLDLDQCRRELIELLLPGVQSHLGSSDVSIRSRGMLVAKVLTKTIDPSGQQIDFEILPSAETEALEKLLVPPPDPGLASVQLAMENLNLPASQPEDDVRQPHSDSVEDLDSDDDLVPYDMSFDKKQTKIKAPKYIRDCMEGLLNSQEGDKFEASLRAAETLIWSRPDGITEIAAEFSKILLHTTESCGIEDFVTLRFQAMLALSVQCPRQVAPYLTSQFYERNYNIRQRLDILEVLTGAAQKLSQPDKPPPHTAGNRLQPYSEIQSPDTRPETWRDVVQRRIDSKTRRFGKGRSQPEPEGTANKFGAVAGEFFYPLMRFCDRGDRYFDLLGNDCMVLHRLVYSLAIILHSAIHTTAARQMGKILMEFTWSLRLHHDVHVRQAVLVATSIILLVVPAYSLLTDLQGDLMETKAWLESVAEKEVNEDCRDLAVQGLRLLESIIAKEMQESVASS